MRRTNLYNDGWTLVEILVVILIITLLAALLLPTLVTARKKGYEPVCISNLRQLGMALAMYKDDYQKLPKYHSFTYLYVKNQDVYKCPVDPDSEGMHTLESNPPFTPTNHLIQTTYLYCYSFLSFIGHDDTLYRADPNHGTLVCALHGELITPPPMTFDDFKGKVLRLRLDGSVQHAQVEHICYRRHDMLIGMRTMWSYCTDVRPVPPEVLRAEFELIGFDPDIVPCEPPYVP